MKKNIQYSADEAIGAKTISASKRNSAKPQFTEEIKTLANKKGQKTQNIDNQHPTANTIKKNTRKDTQKTRQKFSLCTEKYMEQPQEPEKNRFTTTFRSIQSKKQYG